MLTELWPFAIFGICFYIETLLARYLSNYLSQDRDIGVLVGDEV